VSASHLDQVRRIVAAQYDSCFYQQPADFTAFEFRRLNLKLARSESVRQDYTFYPIFLAMDEGRQEAEHTNRALDVLDQRTSLEHLMRGIQQLASEIRTMQPL